jgi:predicted Fe-S protein YdhL (DUF1289 family)
VRITPFQVADLTLAPACGWCPAGLAALHISAIAPKRKKIAGVAGDCILCLDPRMASALKSPCTGICTIERKTRHCRGCKRTLAEIAEWGSASPQRQRQILDALKRRP